MMNFEPARGWRAKLFRMLRWIAPEGSSLDAVFGSYSDWHKFRPKSAATIQQAAPPPPAKKPNAS
jgi:hypothetical protein